MQRNEHGSDHSMSTTHKPAESGTEETAQVLTFGIGEQEYCIGLEYVTEIIDGGEVTPVPSTEEYIEGVMDLRGQTTTILNPLTVMEGDGINPADLITDGGEVPNRIIMLDSSFIDSDGAIGWLVSTVSQVTEIPVEKSKAEGITDSPTFEGVVKKEDDSGFLIWLDPAEFIG